MFECKIKSCHSLGTHRVLPEGGLLCCRHHVLLGGIPSNWHPDCLRAADEVAGLTQEQRDAKLAAEIADYEAKSRVMIPDRVTLSRAQILVLRWYLSSFSDDEGVKVLYAVVGEEEACTFDNIKDEASPDLTESEWDDLCALFVKSEDI